MSNKKSATDLKLQLAGSGVTVHRDMGSPVDIIDGHLVDAITIKYQSADLMINQILSSGDRNFSLYKLFTEHNIIRYAAW